MRLVTVLCMKQGAAVRICVNAETNNKLKTNYLVSC